MRILKFLVTCEDHYAILWAILMVEKANLTYIGWTLTISFQKGMCLPQTIPSCYTTPLSNYNGPIHKRVPPSVLSHKGKWEKNEKGIDFADWLPDLSLINLATDSFSPWITEKLTFCYNHKKKLIISATSQTHLCHL